MDKLNAKYNELSINATKAASVQNWLEILYQQYKSHKKQVVHSD